MRRSVLFAAQIVVALSFLPASAQVAPSLDYEAYTLANGLEVILVEDRSAPVVTIDIWYHVGGANDPVGRSGFAHLFEHMMFQGTANLGKNDLQALVNEAGGQFNAYASLNHTAYHMTLPANELPLGLWLEADRMASLAVTQTNLDNQRAVVIQEYQQNYGGAPYGLAIRDLNTLAYSYEPYQRAPIGAIDEVNQATVAEMIAFHAQYYIPNNATLVVAGDFDKEGARQLIATYFSGIPAGGEPPALPAFAPVQQPAAATFSVADPLIRIPALLIGYEAPPRQHPDYPALQVLDSILTTGNSSRLAQNLMDTGAALRATTSLRPNLGPSLFSAILLPNIGGNVTREEVADLFFAELDRIVAEGVPAEELAKAINILRADRIAGLETAFGLAEQVQVANAYFGDPGAVFTEIDRFAAVTSDDIRRVIAEYLAPEDRHLIVVDPAPPQPFVEPVPFVGAAGTPADDAFTVEFALPFAAPPEALPVTAFNLPPMTQHVLANGLEVVVVEIPGLPMISLDLVYRGGSSLVAGGELGVTGATAELLTRGTTTRSAQEIAESIEGRGGGTGAFTTGDYLDLGIFALAEDRAFAFALLADMARNPVFPEEDLEVAKARLRSQLEAQLADPRAQAGRVFQPAVYGDHPYGALVTLDVVDALTREHLVEYYQRISHPENAILIVGGAISADEAIALAEAQFGDWRGVGTPPVIAHPAIENGIAGLAILLVDIPGAQQAELAIGNLGARGDEPARYALSVANNALGDGLASRLSRNLREEKGYAYSIGSTVTFPVDRGVFRINTRVQPGSVAESVAEIVAEIQRLRTEPMGDAELERVRSGMVGRFALNLETLRAFVDVVASYRVRNLALGDIGLYPGLISAVTPGTALEAAAALIPSDLVVVVAGDAAVLRGPLETLGPVTVLEPR